MHDCDYGYFEYWNEKKKRGLWKMHDCDYFLHEESKLSKFLKKVWRLFFIFGGVGLYFFVRKVIAPGIMHFWETVHRTVLFEFAVEHAEFLIVLIVSVVLCFAVKALSCT
jgi:hypothetical protein